MLSTLNTHQLQKLILKPEQLVQFKNKTKQNYNKLFKMLTNLGNDLSSHS